MKKTFLLFLASLPFISQAQLAQHEQHDRPDSAPQHAPFSASLFIEEDNFNSKYDEDRNYTGGGAITLTGHITESNWFVAPFFRRGLDRLAHIDPLFTRLQKCQSYYLDLNAVSFGTSVFTPEDLEQVTPVIGDRPYSSLVFLSSKKTRVWGDEGCNNFMNDRMAVTTELTLGALGTNVGDSLQTWIHRQGLKKSPDNRPIPLGWHNQISYGGEFTAMYRLSVQNKLGEVYWSKKNNTKAIQLASLMEAQLGYYTNLCAGLQLRVGFFQTPFWANNSNFGSSTNQLTEKRAKAKRAEKDAADDSSDNEESTTAHMEDAGRYENTGLKSKKVHRHDVGRPFKTLLNNFDIYGFAGGRSRLVGYNVMLQGQYNYSAYTLGAADINRMVHEFEVGVAVRLWKLTFMYEPIAGRTSEIKDPAYSRTHIWGAAYLSFTSSLN